MEAKEDLGMGNSTSTYDQQEGEDGQVEEDGSGLVRQTSMEEESAQALLALNKGVAAADGDGKKKKKRGKKGKKKKDKKSEEVVRDSDALGEEEALEGMDVAGGDDLPDSQRIISQHLAAHMSKIAPASASAGTTLHEDEDLLMIETELGYTAVSSPPPLDADDVLSSSAFHTSPVRKKGKAVYEKKKNKRTDPIEDANRLVDPALMEFDEATAAAAAAANISVDPPKDGIAEPRKRKRRLPTEGLGDGPEKKKKSRGKKVSEGIVDSAATNHVQPSPSVPLEQLPIPATPNSALGPISTTTTTTTPSGGSAGGTFLVEEKRAIDVHLERYAEDNGLTHVDLCQRVWANERRKDDFWEGVCSVLPQRSRASIYKHVRRQYHIFNSRAKWTESEDEHLATLVKEKGSAWKAVGDAMGRMGEDCRDRWRNYGKCGKDRGKDRWDELEESELKKTIAEVLIGIRTRRGITDPFDLESNAIDYDGEDEINWTVISDLMGNKRSRIQCRYKWNKMKQQKARSGGVAVVKSPGTWKKKKAKAFVEDMLVGDNIWLLKQYVLTTFKISL